MRLPAPPAHQPALQCSLRGPGAGHTLRETWRLRAPHMLDHLADLSEVDFLPDVDTASARGFTPVEKLSANQQFDAKAGTADLYSRLGVVDDDELPNALAQHQAENVFGAMISMDEAKRLDAVGALSLPEAVKSSVAMLTQYQWNFVAQAQELRSMTVSKIVKETDHADAKIRLQALKLLGSVTEVALFTERVEIKKVDMTPDAIETAIREKLAKFATMVALPAQEVEDATVLEPQGERDAV
jgi:hypothetical protein